MVIEITSDPMGVYWYTGEGQVGDMKMLRGNKAIRDHHQEGKVIHLFESNARGDVVYMGQAAYLGHHRQDRPDRRGDMRSAIIFELGVD